MKQYINAKCNLIFDIFTRNGLKIYAVGGCVRDSLLGLTPKDIDFCTDATPEEMRHVFDSIVETYKVAYEVIPTGERFGTLTLRFHLSNENYEITTFRGEGRYSDNRHPDSISYVRDLKEDLQRRDFTCNAIAWNPTEGYVDPFGGIEDLRNRVLKCVGEPIERFSEDALRILRAIRFAFKYNLSIPLNVVEAALEIMRSRKFTILNNVAKERIGKELTQILDLDLTQNNYNAKSILERVLNIIIENMDYSKSAIIFYIHNPLLRWYFLFRHNLALIDNFALDADLKNKIRRLHSALKLNMDISRPNIKAIYRRHIGMLETEDEKLAFLEYVKDRDRRIFEEAINVWVNRLPCKFNDLAINGTILMDYLDLKPGKLVGQLLNRLFEVILMDASQNNIDSLIKIAKTLIRKNSEGEAWIVEK